MKYDGGSVGLPTKREQDLINYLGNCVADWSEKHTTKRGELFAVLFRMFEILITKQTPFNLDEQYKEIDDLCFHLKLKAQENWSAND